MLREFLLLFFYFSTSKTKVVHFHSFPWVQKKGENRTRIFTFSFPTCRDTNLLFPFLSRFASLLSYRFGLPVIGLDWLGITKTRLNLGVVFLFRYLPVYIYIYIYGYNQIYLCHTRMGAREDRQVNLGSSWVQINGLHTYRTRTYFHPYSGVNCLRSTHSSRISEVHTSIHEISSC